jgi:HAD superfamily hydrolase (TIGR01509 family)
MRKIGAIIFDMDGVLIEAKEWHFEALNKALGLFGMEISRYDNLVTYDGLPTFKKLEMLTRERSLPSELHSFINEMKQIFTMEIVYSRCKPRFHHQYALSRLKKEGYRLAVASNSISQSVKVMLERACLLGYFEFFLSSEDVENPKPDPEIYLKAINRLGVAPQECVVVEDNEKGIQAGRESGAWVLEVGEIEDVNYERIKNYIRHIEADRC